MSLSTTIRSAVLLRWLDDPPGFRARSMTRSGQRSYSSAKRTIGFDPVDDGEVTAARKLGERKGAWANVWKRFAETPDRYPGVAEQLRKARPEQLIVDHADAWPQDNENAEDQLRNAAARLSGAHAGGRPQGGCSTRRRARVAPQHRLGRSR